MSEKKISVAAPIAIATITANEKNLGPRGKTMEYHGPSGFSSCTASKKAATFLHVSVCVFVGYGSKPWYSNEYQISWRMDVHSSKYGCRYIIKHPLYDICIINIST